MQNFANNMSVKTKLVIGFAMTIVLPLLIVCVTTGSRISSKAEDDFNSSSVNLLRQVNASIDTFINDARQNASTIAEIDSVKQSSGNLTIYKTAEQAAIGPSGISAQISGVIEKMMKTHPDYDKIGVGLRDGGYLQAPYKKRDVGYDPTDRPWYKAALETPGKPVVTSAYLTSSGEPVTSIAQSISDHSGQIIGAAAIDLKLQHLSEIIAAIKLGESGYVMVFDADGKILADPKHPDNLFKKTADLNDQGYKAIAELKDTEHATVQLDGREVLATSYKSPELGWIFVGVIDHSEVMAPTYSFIMMVIAIGAVLGAVFIFIGILMARAIAQPLRDASKVLQDIAEGDGDLTMRLNVATGDEVGEMAQWFNKFVSKLEEIISSVKQSAVKVDQATLEVASGSQGVSQATQEQASAIEQVAATVEEMTSSIRQNAGNAEQGRRQTQEMVGLAGDAGQLTEKLVQAMNDISTSSHKIGDIITTVNEVAFQTNLLALNAAVEAARAGEHGKGFAVVAEEVRALAQRSAESSRQVRSLIEDSLAKVQTGDEIVKQSSTAIASIVSRIETVANTMDEIAASSSEQASGVDELNRAIGQIDSSTQQNAGTVEELAGAADMLSQEAELLSSNVARFKVSSIS